MSEWFIIKDLSEFTTKLRAIVFNNFGSWEDDDTSDLDKFIDNVNLADEDEFNKVLSQEESMVIVKSIVVKQRNKKTNKTRYILSDKLFTTVIESLNDRMVSNILHSLVNKGLVETSFDTEANDFVFWIKDYDKHQKEKPETD